MKEVGEEIADREPESALKMGQEHDELAASWLGLDLFSGSPACNLGRDSATGVEPVDGLGRNIRALPAAGGSPIILVRVFFLFRVLVLFLLRFLLRFLHFRVGGNVLSIPMSFRGRHDDFPATQQGERGISDSEIKDTNDSIFNRKRKCQKVIHGRRTEELQEKREASKRKMHNPPMRRII